MVHHRHGTMFYARPLEFGFEWLTGNATIWKLQWISLSVLYNVSTHQCIEPPDSSAAYCMTFDLRSSLFFKPFLYFAPACSPSAARAAWNTMTCMTYLDPINVNASLLSLWHRWAFVAWTMLHVREGGVLKKLLAIYAWPISALLLNEALTTCTLRYLGAAFSKRPSLFAPTNN